MSKPDDGGCAFPMVHSGAARETAGGYCLTFSGFDGLSVKDYFAIRVLAAMVTSARLDGIRLADPAAEAETAYEFADAMVAERAARAKARP